eukprot:gene13389-biopygen1434
MVLMSSYGFLLDPIPVQVGRRDDQSLWKPRGRFLMASLKPFQLGRPPRRAHLGARGGAAHRGAAAAPPSDAGSAGDGGRVDGGVAGGARGGRESRQRRRGASAGGNAFGKTGFSDRVFERVGGVVLISLRISFGAKPSLLCLGAEQENIFPLKSLAGGQPPRHAALPRCARGACGTVDRRCVPRNRAAPHAPIADACLGIERCRMRRSQRRASASSGAACVDRRRALRARNAERAEPTPRS